MRLLIAALFLASTSCVPALWPLGPTTWPLRGTSADPGVAARRPIVVKVANDAGARPQAGLAAADVVLEVPVEGGITRYALIFHSEEPAHVGPVRSARITDIEIVASLGAILVHVGASEAVAREVREAARNGSFVDVDELQQPGAFERVGDRVAPHNAFTSAELVRSAAGDAGDDRVSVPALSFGDLPSGATPGAGGEALTVAYGDPPDVRYEYDAGIGAYRRTQGGGSTVDAALRVEVLPENVIVIRTDVTEIPGTADAAGAPSLQYRATGSGPVVVLRDGRRFDGTWSRERGGMYRFTDGDGAAILLKPGLTWIHIVPMALDP